MLSGGRPGQPWAHNFVDWFTVNCGGQARQAPRRPSSRKARRDIYDFCYLGEVPASVTAGSAAGQPGSTSPARCASRYHLHLAAACPTRTRTPASSCLTRRRSRRCSAARPGWATASPGSAVWTRSSDDPATPGSWSPGRPSATTAATSAPSRQLVGVPPCPRAASAPTCSSPCTAGRAAARAGSTPPTGRTWTSATACSCRRSPGPDRHAPARHPRPLSSTRPAAAAQVIRAGVRGQPGRRPPRIDDDLPAGGLLLRPGVPGESAVSSRVSSPAALDWYRTVYDYSVPEQIRDIYYGLVLDEQPPAAAYTLPAGWLLGPAEPACDRRDQALRLHQVHGAADRAVHVRLGRLAVHHRHLRVRRAGQDPVHDRAGAAQPRHLQPDRHPAMTC